MFTDIEGFTSLMGKNEQQAMRVLEKNRKIEKRLIEKYHGIWLKEIGDGILSAFSSALNAVYCGNAIIQAAKDDPDLNIKVAIHTGEVIFSNGDAFGDGVNVASRIESVAEPNEVTVSSSVVENIRNIEGLEIAFLEEKVFKNIENPVRSIR